MSAEKTESNATNSDTNDTIRATNRDTEKTKLIKLSSAKERDGFVKLDITTKDIELCFLKTDPKMIDRNKLLCLVNARRIQRGEEMILATDFRIYIAKPVDMMEVEHTADGDAAVRVPDEKEWKILSLPSPLPS